MYLNSTWVFYRVRIRKVYKIVRKGEYLQICMILAETEISMKI